MIQKNDTCIEYEIVKNAAPFIQISTGHCNYVDIEHSSRNKFKYHVGDVSTWEKDNESRGKKVINKKD